MNPGAPHYLLCSETSREPGSGRWRFLLKPVDGSAGFEADDVEPGAWGERLDLLTVVRALESLDQPSWVTLIGCTRYVREGVQFGLAEWKENGWRWECFGRMAPIRDIDLWQRMDRILEIHRVDCSQRRFDAAHDNIGGPHDGPPVARPSRDGLARGKWGKCCALTMAACCGLGARLAAGLWGHGSLVAVASAASRR